MEPKMVAVKKIICRLVFLERELEKTAQKYVNITLALPGSKTHKAHGLEKDKVLLKAWGLRTKGGEI